ncbi:MAG: serine O-acetyltransferase, partial [Turicibacter sp.]
LLKIYYLLKIKKMDAYNNASTGTDLNKGAIFKTPPVLPHGLNGIIVAPKSKIGANCAIYQQVTIAEKNYVAPIIGDNCIIGAGAKIVGNVKVGNNVKIGANAVVVKDVPDNVIVAGVPAKIIKMNN